jgi:aerobic-type carbon monoxide dehydrogenase small subunit (CoxS/CutS family)
LGIAGQGLPSMIGSEFRLSVNGAKRNVTCERDTPLLDVLRDTLGLAGPGPGDSIRRMG